MYYRLYCPDCGSDNLRPKRGLVYLLCKILLRRRCMECLDCGHVWFRRRSSLVDQMFGGGYEKHPPVYLQQDNETSSSSSLALPARAPMPAKAMHIDPKRMAAYLTHMMDASMQAAAHQQKTAALLATCITYMAKRDKIASEQQQAILDSQKHMADLIANLSDVFEKTTGQSLPPFSVISSRLRDNAKLDESAG